MKTNRMLGRAVVIACVLLSPMAIAQDSIEVPSALLKIVESVEVSAAGSGVLSELSVREGDIIDTHELLAQVDDTDAQLKYRKATLEAQISEKEANNDVLARLAQKTNELAVTELQRAININTGIPNSVSDRELNVLRLTVEKTALEMEQAQHDRQISELNLDLKRAELELSRHEANRFAIRAPLPGMVVHVEKHPGEWVTAGDLVVRVVRVDRVRAEGFVHAEQAARGLRHRPAYIRVTLPGIPATEVGGKVVFVSPEANPVDGRVRVWAEFENKDFALRPGLRGTMRIVMKTADEGTTSEEPRKTSLPRS